MVGVIPVTLGTRCYVCSSKEDLTCLDDYSGLSKHEQDCSSSLNSDGGCSKVKAKVSTKGVTVYFGKYICTNYQLSTSALNYLVSRGLSTTLHLLLGEYTCTHPLLSTLSELSH